MNAPEVAAAIEARLAAAGVRLTLGGEPTLVPDDPQGAEWLVAAVGPTKLRHAYRLAGTLIGRGITPGAAAVLSPGKRYPGETNPRWVLNLLWNPDGGPPLAPHPPAIPAEEESPKSKVQNLKSLPAFRRRLAARLGLPADAWLPARDEVSPTGRRHAAATAHALPLDHDGERWFTDAAGAWRGLLRTAGRARFLPLVNAAGGAGLRLPLGTLPPDALRRALTVETDPGDGALRVFLPPLLQAPWRELLAAIYEELEDAGIHAVRLDGYVPASDSGAWRRLGLTADPGVLEVNLPPCENWSEYARWLSDLETAGAAVGLRSWKRLPDGAELGTGGGNHLLFGGPSLEENPFFTRPAWLATLLAYFQAHPCLAYAFTGQYVGASSQAPRPDESARDLYDLEMGYRHLAGLPAGENHAYQIGETLRHLHVDVSGNGHLSETSFDKFWNLSGPVGAAAGLIEFRAIESLPRADWMALVALLWHGLAALTLERSGQPLPPLARHGLRLHDAYFLPTPLWEDFRRVLHDLRAAGFAFEEAAFRPLWEWRFPALLRTDGLTVRRACEGWPLLSETPSEGGSTSRFVDTSIERLEFAAAPGWARAHRVWVHGRELSLNNPLSVNVVGAGLRYRRTALYPSLHPGIPPHLPLEVLITSPTPDHPVQDAYRLEENQRQFQRVPSPERGPDPGNSCQRSSPELLTYDLRLPAPGGGGPAAI